MHSTGYLDRTATSASPSRLAIVIALHGAAITALMLAPPEIVPRIDWKPIDLIQIDDKPLPPEVLPEPAKPKVKEEVVTQTVPLVPIGTTDSGTITFSQPGTDNGTVAPPVTPITNPVIEGAVFVRGVAIQPDYPTSLARQEIEGHATVRVLIGTDGRVKDVQQVSATDPEFFKATERQARRQWRFKPATRDGVPIESWREMTVRFKLEA